MIRNSEISDDNSAIEIRSEGSTSNNDVKRLQVEVNPICSEAGGDDEIRDSVKTFGSVVKCEGDTMEVEVTNHHEEKLPLFKRPEPRQQWIVNPALRENPNAPQYINTMSLDSKEQHRTATASDLVLDLVYVVILAQQGHHYASGTSEGHSVEANIRFFSLFLPIWSQWYCVSAYLNRWETHDVMNIIFFVGNLTLMGVVGVSSRECDVDASENNEEECSLRVMNFFFAASRMWVLLFEIMVVYFHHDEPYMKSMYYIMSFDAMVTVSWLIAGSVAESESCDENDMDTACYNSFVFFWWLAISLDLIKLTGNAVVAKFGFFKRQEVIPINVSLAAERMELFIVISIGEVIAAAVDHADSTADEYEYGLTALTVLIAAMIKIRYFDFAVHPTASGNDTQVRLHAMRTAPLRGMGYVVSHIPLNAFIVMLGANLDVILSHTDEGVDEEVLLSSSHCIAVIISVCTIIDLLHSTGDSKVARKPVVAVVNGVFVVLALILPYCKDFTHDAQGFLSFISLILLGNVSGTHQMSKSRTKIAKLSKVTVNMARESLGVKDDVPEGANATAASDDTNNI